MPGWSTGSRLSEITPLRNSTVRERKCNKGAQGLKEEKVRQKKMRKVRKYCKREKDK
jgi:hypothetical protein